MILDSLAIRLKSAREDRGLSQSKLARLVGITPQAIQALEAGTSAGSKHLPAIAGALGVEAIWLAAGTGEKKRKPRKDVSDPSEAPPPGNIYFLVDNDDNDDGWSFPPTRIKYHPNTVPIFLCENTRDARMPKRAKIEVRQRILGWLRGPNEDVAQDRIDDLATNCFMHISRDTPEDYASRPQYLYGQAEGYAIYINDNKNICPVNINHTIAYVTPHKKISVGDIVIVWHVTNTFIVSRVSSINDEYIGLENQILLEDMLSETDFDKSLDMKTDFILKRDQIKSIHCILGLDFAKPNSSRIYRGIAEDYDLQKNL